MNSTMSAVPAGATGGEPGPKAVNCTGPYSFLSARMRAFRALLMATWAGSAFGPSTKPAR